MDSQNAGSSQQVPESRTHDEFKNYDREQLAFNINDYIGEGGYGTVYKGTDLINGNTVAIKKLHNHDRMEHFEAEYDIIKNLRHPNLVKIFGRCLDDNNRLVVLEYMPNKSLRFHLHGTDGEPVLNWSNRMRIALGSAEGIAYLHGIDPPVIHRDIKPNNILLDNEFEPKIADFGLSRLMPEDKSYIASKTYGTMGYVARECSGYPHHRFTAKSDVFAFGVVLLELITGKKPIISDDMFLYQWVEDLYNSGTTDLMDIVDDKLNGKYDTDQKKRMIRCGVASICEYADDRPTMSEIVQVLKGTMNWKHLSFFERERYY